MLVCTIEYFKRKSKPANVSLLKIEYTNVKERLLINDKNESTFRLPKKNATHTRKNPKMKNVKKKTTADEKIFQKNLRKNGGGLFFKMNLLRIIYLAKRTL